MPQIQWSINSYQARALPLSAQRIQNLYAEAAPKDAKSPVILYGTPGIKSFVDSVGDGPIRGARNFDGTLFAVSGNMLYEINAGAIAVSRGEINTSVGPISMSHNQATTAELILVDGVDGWIYKNSARDYRYNNVTTSIPGSGSLRVTSNGDSRILSGSGEKGGLVKIADGDFFAADVVDFQDQYFILIRKGTGQFFLSNLNAGAT